GFIGGARVRRLLKETTATMLHLANCGNASDLTGIEHLDPGEAQRYRLLRVDLVDAQGAVFSNLEQQLVTAAVERLTWLDVMAGLTCGVRPSFHGAQRGSGCCRCDRSWCSRLSVFLGACCLRAGWRI
ncbi:MAG: hypothetical protein WAM11_04315, partial [Cyanobium sp.]